MTDNEIIKALECCLKNECDECQFKDNELCQIELMKLLFDLINRQKAIIEKSEKVEYFADNTIATLQAENERLEVENQSLRGAANSLKMHYEEAQTEIERLKVVKGHIDTLIHRDCEYPTAKAYNEAFQKALERLYDSVNVKSEAVKEFAERLKNEIVEALRSNYNAQNERILKTNEVDEFVKYCDGKIHALRGIDDFIDNLVKEMVCM